MEKTLNLISRVLSRVNTHPEYSQQARREKDLALHEDANKHSVSIEMNGETNGKYHQDHAKYLRGMNEAWQILGREGLTIESIMKLGNKIEPEKNRQETFRHTSIHFGTPQFEGTPARLIYQEMDNLVQRIGLSQYHPLVRAIEAHIETVRIHPWIDGNGRAARLLQNFCLKEKGYPPAIITPSDKDLYIHLLQRTISDRLRGGSEIGNPSENEVGFRKYIASRVLVATEDLERALRSRRVYDVVVQGAKPGECHAICNYIRGYGRGPTSQGVSVRYDKSGNNKKGVTLHVIGDMGAEELRVRIRALAKKHRFSYRVEVKS